MAETPKLTPLGQLLEHARVEVLHISAREAARRAGISNARWRQVVTGSQMRAGRDIGANPSVRVVVAMAHAVGVDPVRALAAANLETDPIYITLLVADIEERKQAARKPPAPPIDSDWLTTEIERIKNLPVSFEAKKALVRAVIDLATEEAASIERTEQGKGRGPEGGDKGKRRAL